MQALPGTPSSADGHAAEVLVALVDLVAREALRRARVPNSSTLNEATTEP